MFWALQVWGTSLTYLTLSAYRRHCFIQHSITRIKVRDFVVVSPFRQTNTKGRIGQGVKIRVVNFWWGSICKSCGGGGGGGGFSKLKNEWWMKAWRAVVQGLSFAQLGRMAIDGSCFIHWFELCSGRGWRTASTDNFAICSHLPRWPVQTHKHGNWLAICIFCTSFRGLQPAANYRPTLAPASSRTNWRWRHLTGNFSWPMPLDLIWLLDTRTSS